MQSRKFKLGLGVILALVGTLLVYGSTYDPLVNFLVSSFRLRPSVTGFQACLGGALCPDPGLTVRLAMVWSGLVSLLIGSFLLGFSALHRTSRAKTVRVNFTLSETG